MSRKSLATWIDEALVDPDKEGRISAIALVHMVGQQRQELHVVKIGESGSYEGKTLGPLFQGKAKTYAQDMETVQSFALLVFYGGSNTEQAIMPFKVLPEINPETAGLSTEAPTPEGRMMQKMRWDDALQMQVYARQQRMDDHSIRLLEQSDRMLARSMALNERLVTENMDNTMMVRDMLVAQGDKRHEHRMSELAFQRASGEREKFIKFAPVLVNTIFGREIFPQSTADTALIESIAENVDDTMIEKLAGLGLDPMVMGPLAARVMKALEDKEKGEAAKTKALAPYSGTPQDDIGGG